MISENEDKISWDFFKLVFLKIQTTTHLDEVK